MTPKQQQAYDAALYNATEGLNPNPPTPFAMAPAMTNAAPGETYDFIAQQATPTPEVKPEVDIPLTPRQAQYGTQFEPGSAEGLRQQLNQQQAAGDIEDIRKAEGELKKGKVNKSAAVRAKQKAFDNQPAAEIAQDTVDTPQGVLPFQSPMEDWKAQIEKVAQKYSVAGYLIRKALAHEDQQTAAKAIREQAYKLRPARAADTSEKAQSSMIMKLKALNSAHTVLTGQNIRDFVSGGSEAQKFARLTEGLTDKQRLYFSAAIGENTGVRPDSQVQIAGNTGMRQYTVAKLAKSTEAALKKVAEGTALTKKEARDLFDKARRGELSSLSTDMRSKLDAALEEYQSQMVSAAEQASDATGTVTGATRYDEGGYDPKTRELAEANLWTNATIGKSNATGDSSIPSAHAKREYEKIVAARTAAGETSREWDDLSRAEQLHISDSLKSVALQPSKLGEEGSSEFMAQSEDVATALSEQEEKDKEIEDLIDKINILEESKDEEGADKKAINAELKPLKKELKKLEAAAAVSAIAREKTVGEAVGKSPAGAVKAETKRVMNAMAASEKPTVETERQADTPIDVETQKKSDAGGDLAVDEVQSRDDLVAQALIGKKINPKIDVGTEIENSVEEWDALHVEGDPKWDELSDVEQTAWIVNYIKWKSDHFGMLQPKDMKANLVRSYENARGIEEERTKPTVQSRAGKAESTEGNAPSAIQEAFARAKKEARPAVDKFAKIVSDRAAGARETIKGILSVTMRELLNDRVSTIEKDSVANAAKAARLAAVQAAADNQIKLQEETRSEAVESKGATGAGVSRPKQPKRGTGETNIVRNPGLAYKFEKVANPEEPGEVATKKYSTGEESFEPVVNPLSIASTKAVVEQVSKRFPNAPKINVVELSDVPENDRNKKGWFDTSTGGVTIVADKHDSPANVVATYFHEVAGHYGLAGAFNTELNKILDDAYTNANVKSIADEAMAKDGISQREATEEVLAEYQVRFKSAFMDRIKAAIAKTLRAIGKLVGKNWYENLSDAEVKEILRAAKNYATDGTKPPTPTGEGKKFRSASADTVLAHPTPADFEPTTTFKGKVVDVVGRLQNLGISFREMAQIEREYKDLPIEPYTRLTHLTGAYAKNILDRGVNSVLNVWNTFAEAENKQFTDMLNKDTLGQFLSSEDVTHPRNKWIQDAVDNAKDGRAEDITNAGKLAARFQAQRDAFNRMPKKLQELYREVDSFMQDMAKEEFKNRAGATVDAFLPQIKELATPEQREAIGKLSYSNEPDMKEFSAYKKAMLAILKGTDPKKVENQKAVDTFREMANEVSDKMEGYHQRKGLYFPLLRFGDHLVIAKSQVFAALEKTVDDLKSQMNDFKKNDAAMKNYAELVATAAEARDAARGRLRSPSARTGFLNATNAVKEFKKSQEYKDAARELADIRGDLKDAAAELKVKAAQQEHYAFHREESQDKANQRVANYKANGMDAVTKLRDEWIDGMDTVSAAFSKKLIDKLSAHYQNDPAMQARISGTVRKIFTDTQHDQSALHRMAMRRNVAGFHPDGNRVFQSFLQQSSHRLAAQRYFMETQDALENVRRAASENDKSPTAKEKLTAVANELAIRNDMDMQYRETPIQDSVARFTQLMTLGMSPAFLLQQSAQPMMLTLPQLRGRSSSVEAAKALTGAISDAWRILRASAKGSGLMNRFAVKLDHPLLTAGEKQALHEISDLGLIDILLDHDVALGAKGKQMGRYDKFVEMTNWAGRQIEVVNRISSALAAYREEIRRGGTQAEATKYAANVVEQSQVDYSNENASRWTKRGAFSGSKVITQFKKYQIHMIQMLVWNAKEAVAGETPAARTEARRILVGMLTTHGIMGGTLGLPFAAPVFGIAKLVSMMWPSDDRDDPETAYKNFLADMLGKDLGDVVARGVFASLGLDLSRTLGLGTLFNPVPFVRTDKQGKDLLNEMVLGLLGPSVSIGQRVADGASKLSNGDLLGAWIGMAPKFLASPARSFKTGTEGITTKEGNTRIPAEQFTGGDLAAIALGLPDLKVSKYYEYNSAFEDSKAAAAQKVAMLKHAWVRGDAEEKAKVQQQIDEFNNRHETDQIKQKDLFAAQRQEAAYHKKVTPEGLMVSKKTREFAEGIRF